MFRRPNPPAIMQSTTALTPEELFSSIHILYDNATVVAFDKKGRAVERPFDRNLKIDDSSIIQIINEDELKANISWYDAFGYRVYALAIQTFIKNRDPNDKKNKYIENQSVKTTVPDLSFIVAQINRYRRSSAPKITRKQSVRTDLFK